MSSAIKEKIYFYTSMFVLKLKGIIAISQINEDERGKLVVVSLLNS